MGYKRHHAIIVTSWDAKELKDAYNTACGIFPIVSNITKMGINNYQSFFVPPDGSKEGWDESNEGDRRRKRFIEYLDQQRYEDGSICLDWVEIQYGDDDGITKITCHSDEERREERFVELLGSKKNDKNRT